MELATALKAARQRANLSQQAVADELHISRQSISKWETGKTLPDIENLIRLSTLFDLSLDDLIKGDTTMMTKISHDSKVFMIVKIVLATIILTIIFALTVAFSLTQFTPGTVHPILAYVPALLSFFVPVGSLLYMLINIRKQPSRGMKVALILALAGVLCLFVLRVLAYFFQLPYVMSIG
ncbi:Transcriptional regulator [Furfurilactobacillus rossiae]|uniref:helix-turn-helix domain-containing protein n=1 Tax=Furfurilactobacillus rossiae TaxID=231049 RepID=UPI0015B964C3|nr:helix-turn-helix transcriptional regulator [Furfurilactobacillus rossiae]MCF6166336.1 helix-turn-helix domain-containing protein [Furfurilactobacillus rossiae]QLE65095.1 Transcriptional regulator [Furfurilactobacillus rossiae]